MDCRGISTSSSGYTHQNTHTHMHTEQRRAQCQSITLVSGSFSAGHIFLLQQGWLRSVCTSLSCCQSQLIPLGRFQLCSVTQTHTQTALSVIQSWINVLVVCLSTPPLLSPPLFSFVLIMWSILALAIKTSLLCIQHGPCYVPNCFVVFLCLLCLRAPSLQVVQCPLCSGGLNAAASTH